MYVQCREAFVCSLSYVLNSLVWRKSKSSLSAPQAAGEETVSPVFAVQNLKAHLPQVVKHRGTRKGGAVTHLCMPFGRCTRNCVSMARQVALLREGRRCPQLGVLLSPLLLRFRSTCGALRERCRCWPSASDPRCVAPSPPPQHRCCQKSGCR